MVVVSAPLPFETQLQDDGVIRVGPKAGVAVLGRLVAERLELGEEHRVTLRAIGAGAVNQAIKATIHARQILAGHAEDMIVVPGNKDIPDITGKPVTAVVLHCYTANNYSLSNRLKSVK
jgi:stage V sporulation protein SpoVS